MFVIVSIQRWLEPRLAESIRSSGMPMFKNTSINHFQVHAEFFSSQIHSLGCGVVNPLHNLMMSLQKNQREKTTSLLLGSIVWRQSVLLVVL